MTMDPVQLTYGNDPDIPRRVQACEKSMRSGGPQLNYHFIFKVYLSLFLVKFLSTLFYFPILFTKTILHIYL